MPITEYYVSPSGKDTWTGTLPDPNATGTDGPFATLQRARDAMRTGPAKTTFVRGGDYRVTATLALTGLDNGTAYYAYPGEAPVIHGSAVQSVTALGNGKFAIAQTATTGLDFFVNGERQRVSQYPDYGDDYTTGWLWAATTGTKTAIYAKAGSLSGIARKDGMWCQGFDWERLSDGLSPVSAISGDTVTLASPYQYVLRPGGTFRLLNNAAWVRRPGEFGWDPDTKRLVFWPKSTTSPKATLPVAGRFITITGAADITVQGLTFRENTRTEAIRIEGDSRRIHIWQNRFEAVGKAVQITGSHRCLVEGNIVLDVIDNGIYLDGGSTFNRIAGNTLSGIGTAVTGRKNGTAIGGNGISDNEIVHNDIANCARYGISIKDWLANNANCRNLIAHNTVSNTLLEGADGAAIETLGRSENQIDSVIRDNRIVEVYGIATWWDAATQTGGWNTKHKSFGIYLDDKSGHITVRGNFIAGIGTASVYLHGGDWNRVENNIGVITKESEEFIRIEWMGPAGGESGKPQNNTVERNIIYSTSATELKNYWTLYTPGVFTIANNLVWMVQRYWPGGTDTQADPRFVAPAQGDFRLLPDSPASGLGIQDLDWGRMGLAGYVPTTRPWLR